MSATLTGLPTIPSGVVVMPGPMLTGGHPLQLGEAIANTFNPAVSGLARPVGSFVYTRDGTAAYIKTGVANNAWAAAGASSGTLTAPITVELADATTVTSPDVLILRHITSAAAGVNFGLSVVTELENAAGTTKRAIVENDFWTNASAGSEISRRTISAFIGGVSQVVAAFGDFVTVPALYVGDPAHQNLLRDVSSSQFQIMCGATTNFTLATTITTANLPLATDRIAMAPPALSSGVLTKLSLIPGADTGGTASTEAFDVDFNFGRTRTWATGAIATQRSMVVRPPTLAFVGASVVTAAATLAITGAPAAGANATITNSYALWVQAGATRIDGNFGFGVAPIAASVVAALTNNVTAGGTNDIVANYTDLAVYANDSNAIRNDIYQLSRKVGQILTALKANGVVV